MSFSRPGGDSPRGFFRSLKPLPLGIEIPHRSPDKIKSTMTGLLLEISTASWMTFEKGFQPRWGVCDAKNKPFPTGFSSVPPVGPAIPVTLIAKISSTDPLGSQCHFSGHFLTNRPMPPQSFLPEHRSIDAWPHSNKSQIRGLKPHWHLKHQWTRLAISPPRATFRRRKGRPPSPSASAPPLPQEKKPSSPIKKITESRLCNRPACKNGLWRSNKAKIDLSQPSAVAPLRALRSQPTFRQSPS